MGLGETRIQGRGEKYVMRSFVIFTPHQTVFSDKIEKNEMDRELPCCVHGRGEAHTVV
jgi:hypothetical protein